MSICSLDCTSLREVLKRIVVSLSRHWCGCRRKVRLSCTCWARALEIRAPKFEYFHSSKCRLVVTRSAEFFSSPRPMSVAVAQWTLATTGHSGDMEIASQSLSWNTGFDRRPLQINNQLKHVGNPSMSAHGLLQVRRIGLRKRSPKTGLFFDRGEA